MFATQYKADEAKVRDAVKRNTLHNAPLGIASTLQSADTRSAWTDVYSTAMLHVGREFAGNTQLQICGLANVPVPSTAETDATTQLLRRIARYAPARVDAMLASTTRILVEGLKRAQDDHRAQQVAAKVAKVPMAHQDTLDTPYDVFTADDLDNYLTYTYKGFQTDGADALADHETAVAGNVGQFVGAEVLGGLQIEKVWSAVGDNKTRPWHADMDGVSVPLDEAFDVDGEQLSYPLDDSLGASGKNIFACRCTTYYQPAGE